MFPYLQNWKVGCASTWSEVRGRAAYRPASQVLRELMREFIQSQRKSREYDEFLRRKVEAGRASMRAGMGRSNDEVEAEFTARRASVASQS